MSILQDPVDKRRGLEEYPEDFLKTYRRNPGAMSPKTQVEQEKRVRREIANSNERRRMQSINSGFEQIRRMLPPPQEGEKYSKATILQLAVKYIQNLETEANRLANQLKMYSPNSTTSVVNCIPVSTGTTNLQTTGLNQNQSNTTVGPHRKRKIDESGAGVDFDSLKRRTMPSVPGAKTYEDLNSENVNLRQHVGKLTSDKDSMQRQIDYLRQHLADVVSSNNIAHRQDIPTAGSGNPAGANASGNTTMTAYTLPIQTRIPENQPTVQMTIQGQSQGKNSFQVQKVFTNQQQLPQSGTLLTQQVQHLSHDGSKVKFAGNLQQQSLQHQQLLNQIPQCQQSRPLRQKQQEIIAIATPASSINTNVPKPGFEPFAVEPGSVAPAAAVALTRSSESTSPQPLTLTPVTPVDHVMHNQPTIPKKSLDALVLAIQQIEGTSMGSNQEDVGNAGDKSVSSTGELDIQSVNNKAYTIANNNNNVKAEDSNVSYQTLSSNYQISQPVKPEEAPCSNIAQATLPHESLEDIPSTTATTSQSSLPVVSTVTISSDSKCDTHSSQSPEHANASNPTTSEEYPIVTKLLNRPIPHKYLHRPQVVVNSSH